MSEQLLSALSFSGPFVRATASHGTFVVIPASACDDAQREAARVYAQAADLLADRHLTIIQERMFTSPVAESAVRSARRQALHARGLKADELLTCVHGAPAWGEGFAGVILRALPEGDVHTLCDEGVPCGRAWGTGSARFAILQNLQGWCGEGGQPAPGEQTRRVLQQADRILRGQGGSYRDTLRTWFYLRDILDWYGEFNQARNDCYRSYGLISAAGEPPHRLPASTGIRAGSSRGGACTLDLLAAIGTGGESVEFLRNPRQQEAFCYGSAFSRCAIVHGASEDLIEVSGTAAIDECGRSLYPGDIRAQTRCTLERMSALLERANATLRDICAATVFVKRGTDARAAREVLADQGLAEFPALWVQADVCRDELLFEIDAEAVVPQRV